MFHSDQPINKKEYDCLNRTEFSKQLAKAIWSYTKNDNFAISLCGKWGSGKTSIINMVIEEIEDLTRNLQKNQKPIIVKFNPWNYSDCSQLIKQFFVTIQNQLKIFDGSEKLNTVGNALQKYSSVLDYSTYIPVIGQYLSPVKDLLAGVGEHLVEAADENKSIDVQKQKVIEALREQEQKIIVIIDDIDRLNNAQIRAIFQLVNSLAGFPNMIYLLSFDREVVTRALQEEQKCDGEEYLEKIIQVPFEVPEANKDLVNEVLFNRLNDVIFSGGNPDTSFDSEYWGTVFSNCISPYIVSIRDVNRVVNAFEFKYELMRNEVNVVDLLALTTLQVCAPEIFRWIYNNSERLTGSIESAGGISRVEQKANSNKYIELFEKVYPRNAGLMLNILRTLFPKFSWLTGGYNRSSESNDELRYKDKIASEERLKRYFNLSLEEIQINKSQIKNTLFEYNENELRDFMKLLLVEGGLVAYLQELLAYIQDVPKNRVNLFTNTLTVIQTMDMAYERKTIFSPIPARKCYDAILAFLKHGDENDNALLIEEMITNADATNMSIICGVVEELEEAYGRKGNSSYSTYQFIAEDKLEAIEKLLLNKIKEVAETGNYFDYHEVEYVYRMWSFLEKDTLDLYVKKILCFPENVPKYLKICAGTWTGGKTSGWDFGRESFSEHIDKQEAYQKICTLKNTEEFSMLHYSVKEIAIAFYLWAGCENCDYHDISKESVSVVIPEWEKLED